MGIEVGRLRQEVLRGEGDLRQQSHASKVASAALSDTRNENKKLRCIPLATHYVPLHTP